MKFDKNTKIKDFIMFLNITQIEQKEFELFFDKIGNLTMPKKIAGKIMPENLNFLTWAEFSALNSITKTEDLFFIPFEVLCKKKFLKWEFKPKRKRILKLKLFEVILLIKFIQKEIERIVKLFDKIQNNPTDDEIRAGINNLNFGLFGTLDWYCRRMGITDHKQGEKTLWIRIYKCLEIDNKTAKFERRLHDIINQKYKIKK